MHGLIVFDVFDSVNVFPFYEFARHVSPAQMPSRKTPSDCAGRPSAPLRWLHYYVAKVAWIWSEASWAIDFFTVTTISFPTLYVLLVFDHGRRKVIHVATTYCPS